MKKASLLVDYHLGNKIFDLDDRRVNRDNSAHWFFQLKEEFANSGYDLCTYDINKPEESEIVVCFDKPSSFHKFGKQLAILILLEPPAVKAKNYIRHNWRAFDLIFTWDDGLVDGEKVFKYQYGNKIPKLDVLAHRQKRTREKFSVMVCGNKFSRHSDELYSKRYEIIKWYSEHLPSQFDLFGMGWDQQSVKFRSAKMLLSKSFGFKFEVLTTPKVFRGKIDSKLNTLEDYKFCFCLENQSGTQGYITEKIFDSFFAGCIPVYEGPDNIEHYIPSDCFIYFRSFDNIRDCNLYLTSLSQKQIDQFHLNAIKFLQSSAGQTFSSDYFARNIVEKIKSKKVEIADPHR